MNTITGLVPVCYFQGALPPMFEWAPDQSGWLVILTLSQDGSQCWLPLAWECQQQTQDDERPSQHPPLPAFTTSALDSEAVALTIKNLQNSGWQIDGRITIHFTGKEAEPDFALKTQAYLWQKPTKKEEV
jgi:hypothetical protein